MKIKRAYAPEPVRPRARRRVWFPADARAVKLACGHIDSEWPFVKALKILHAELPIRSVWCERCKTWQEILHYATPAEVAGIQVIPQTGDDPPF